MDRYNPDKSPNPAEWLALDEQLRIMLVETYHRKARVKLPDSRLHATFHSIVENQLAENLAPVVRAIARLRKEGLSRHDAVHAVGSVLAEHLNDLMSGKLKPQDSEVVYSAAVDRLTAKAWLES